MKDLTVVLFERLGLVLIFAFVLTRTPGFRSLLYREFNRKMIFVHAFVFGLFGIASTMMGIIIDGDTVVIPNLLWSVENDQVAVSSSLVAVVIAGLLGGPLVGLGAGMIAGIHLFFLGGIGWLANVFVNPLTGLLAGLTARFFSQERVISPMKALFIGVFPPILQMQLMLVFHPHADHMVAVVDQIGLPLVLSNSIAIAIFTAMIGIVLKEQENEAAMSTRRALTIAEEALPFLEKGYRKEMAIGISNLLYERLEIAAVSVTDGETILAHKGLGADHHLPGEEIVTTISQEALENKKTKVAYTREEIQCQHPNCPLEAAIIIPIGASDYAKGLIKFYYRKAQHIRPADLVLAEGLGKLISNQLQAIEAERLKAYMRDAELRNLQAQINPHFLFNTLHIIAALFRKEPERARHITVQLANYMRFNLGLVSNSLIELERECEHVRAYIEIIQARFAGRLQITFHQARGISQVYVPPSTIQPLVENSVQHGLKNVIHNGKIEVRIEKMEDSIRVTVTDNGSGFPEHILTNAGEKELTKGEKSTGLYNVNQRLIRLLGEKSRLHIKNLPAGGSEVSFSIPMVIQKEVEVS